MIMMKSQYLLPSFFTVFSLCLSQTNIGSILAAVNPYKQISDLYDLSAVELYSRHHLGELPPHIFAVANESYRCLWKRHDSQCVLIRYSGVGGVGRKEQEETVAPTSKII